MRPYASRFTRRSVALTLAALTVLGAPATARRREPSTGLRALSFSKPPPDFTYDAGAGPHRLDELVGKPVVLNFWASWCEPCRAELDAFATLRATYGDAVPLLTVSYEEAGVARAFLTAQHADLPLIEDPTRAIFDLYSVSSLPVTIVLGRDGTVRYVSVGEVGWNELQAAVEAAKLDPPAHL